VLTGVGSDAEYLTGHMDLTARPLKTSATMSRARQHDHVGVMPTEA
jgi:hypothetical protein